MMHEVVAVILAAGESRRMGAPKMVLPWGQRTVIGQVVSVIQEAGLHEIIMVIGGAETAVRETLQGEAVQVVPNERYATGEMLSSVQTGLAAAMSGTAQAALIVLGDQPQIQVEVVRQLLRRWQETRSAIVIPSYHMRRGHPWLLPRSLWQEVIELPAGQTLRDFLNVNRDRIDYQPVENDSILLDLDTPDEYERQRPKV
jgi:molybdenum cofactor cytidylyltransferase